MVRTHITSGWCADTHVLGMSTAPQPTIHMPTKSTSIKRSYSTVYYRDSFTESKGAASTEQGAIRAAIVRVFLGQYDKAEIVNRHTGSVLYTLKRGARGISTHYGQAVGFKTWEE